MAEQRLIDVESLKKSIRETTAYTFADTCQMVTGASNQTVWYREQDISRCIATIPTIEAKPVVHAHWALFGKDGTDTDYGCTNCGYTFTTSGSYPQSVHYCPYCGAKMDEEVE